MPKTLYEEIEEENRLKEHQFRIFGRCGKENSIELLEPGKTWRGLASVSSTQRSQLEKINLALTPNQEKTAQHSLDLVNKNGKYETTIWTTTPTNIKKALRAGFFEATSIANPIAKMIAQIGAYQRKVHEHVLITGQMEAAYPQKNYLAETTQDYLFALNGLHALINHYNEGLTPEANFQLILKELQKLKDEILRIETQASGDGEPYDTMKEGLHQLKAKLEDYEKSLIKFKAHKGVISRKDLVDNLLRPYGLSLNGAPSTLQAVLQEQINILQFYAGGANNLITSAWSGLMGRDALGQCLLAARFTGEKFSNSKIDYHNPVTAAHAFDFSGMENQEGLVTMDTEKFGFHPKTELELLRGLDSLQALDREENVLEKYQGQTKKQRGRIGKIGESISRIGGNFFKDILGCGADFFYGLGYSLYAGFQELKGSKMVPAEFPSSHWPSLRKKVAGEEETYQSFESQAFSLKVKEKTRLPQPSFVEQAFQQLKRIAAYLIVDPIKGLATALKHGSDLGTDLRHDFTGGSLLSTKEVQALLDENLEANRKRAQLNQEAKKSFIAAYNSYHPLEELFQEAEQQAKLAPGKKGGKIQPAFVPYHLTPDDPSDTFSWATNDFIQELAEVFSHEVYRAHPLAGLAFSAAVSTAAPLVLPSLAQNTVLHFINTQITMPIVHTFVGSESTGFMAAFSTALLQGKLAYLATDALNGEDSVLARNLKATIENPVLAFSMCSLAVGFGYAVAYKMQIPLLSAGVAAEAEGATLPYVELGTTGAHIAAILIGNTVNLKQSEETPLNPLNVDELLAQYRDKIVADLEKGYKREKKLQVLQESDRVVLEKMVQNYCQEFKKQYHLSNLKNKTYDLNNKLKQQLDDPKLFRELWKPQTPDLQLKEALVNKIMALDATTLSRKKALQLMDYVQTQFADDPAYVAAVKEKLETEPKRGPLFHSLQRILWHAGQLLTLRPLLSGIQWGVYSSQVAKANKNLNRDPHNPVLIKEKERLQASALLARNRCVGYFKTVGNDLGRIVKGGATLLRKTWDLAGSFIHNIAETLALMVPWRTGKFRSKMTQAFFAPGKVSQALDAAVGELRASATTKNLAVASRDLLLREQLKSQVSTVGQTMEAYGTQQTQPIILARPSASKNGLKGSHSSTSSVLESEYAEGHAWQSQIGVPGMRCLTFSRGLASSDMDKELRKLWTAPQSVKMLKASAVLAPLLANQTRAKELCYPAQRAVLVETLSADRVELASKLIFSGDLTARLVYDQLKSGIEEYQRHHEPQEGEFITVFLPAGLSVAFQKLYLLCSIKLGCRCCDEKNQEIYSPDFEANTMLTVGSDTLSLSQFQEQATSFLEKDFEPRLAVKTAVVANDTEYREGRPQEPLVTDTQTEGEREDNKRDDGASSHHNLH